MAQTLQATRFAGCPVVPVAARPGGCGGGLLRLLGLTGMRMRWGMCACCSTSRGPCHHASLAGTAAGDDAGADSAADAAPVGVLQLVETLLGRVRLRQGAGGAASSGISSSSSSSSAVVSGSRGAVPEKEPFLFYVDHCFAIKGQGTVMTGAPADLLLCQLLWRSA